MMQIAGRANKFCAVGVGYVKRGNVIRPVTARRDLVGGDSVAVPQDEAVLDGTPTDFQFGGHRFVGYFIRDLKQNGILF